MMKTLKVAALLAVSIGCWGCGKNTDELAAEASQAAATPAELGVAKSGEGKGTVAAVDAAAGTITLEHGAIPAVGWPAMKMGFSAKKDLLAGIAVGDKVGFEVKVTQGEGQVTAIKKQ